MECRAQSTGGQDGAADAGSDSGAGDESIKNEMAELTDRMKKAKDLQERTLSAYDDLDRTVRQVHSASQPRHYWPTPEYAVALTRTSAGQARGVGCFIAHTAASLDHVLIAAISSILETEITAFLLN